MYPLIILLRLTSSRGLHPRLGGAASEDVGEYASPPAGGSATLPSKNPALAGPRYIKTKVNAKHAKDRQRRFEYIGVLFSCMILYSFLLETPYLKELWIPTMRRD
jgi:hypothetical protein